MRGSFFILSVIFFLTSICTNRVESEVKNNSILVSTEWLINHFDDPSLVILHVGRKDQYDEEHIPGARLISMRSLIIDSNNLSHEMPSITKIDSILKSIGINDDSHIIITYENDMLIPIATRLYLTLDYAGIGNQTSLLNGGFTKWKNENRIVTKAIAEISEGNFSSQANNEIFVDAEWISKNLRNPQVILIDARPVEQYEGREEESERPRPGHITGAVNLRFFDLTDEDYPYQFKEIYELKKMFEQAGVKEESTIVTYCGTGIWSSNVYIIAKHLGYDVRFYDASYQEWSENESLPITSPVSVEKEN